MTISLSPPADAWCTSQPADSRYEARRAMKRTIFAVLPRTVIETWALECVFYKKYSGCCDMAKVLCILCTGSFVHIQQTLHSCIHMLLDSVIQVIQHGIDGAHRQWCTLPYTMGEYYHIYYQAGLLPGAKSPSTVAMEYMFPFHQWCIVVVTGCQVA